MNATSRRSLRLLCGEYGQVECEYLCAIWSRDHGLRSVHRRDDEKLQFRDGHQAEHLSASQGAEPAGFSAQNGSRNQGLSGVTRVLRLLTHHTHYSGEGAPRHDQHSLLGFSVHIASVGYLIRISNVNEVCLSALACVC